MKFKLLRVGDEVRAASVTVTEAERYEVISSSVPFIYSPGGFGIDWQEAIDGNTLLFAGACFVEREKNLLAALENFRGALREAIKRRAKLKAEAKQAIEDEEAGYGAFPGGRFADALRGTKSFPDHVRCPFKQPARVAAWEAGYDRAHESLIEAFSEAA
jgi:hypothetical protein